MNTDPNILSKTEVDLEFKKLMARPEYAWPTIGLFVLYITSFITSTYFALQGSLPIWVATLVNAACCYLAYTVLHEASHRLIIKNKFLNDWMGRISLFFVSIAPFYKAYRFLHMVHHGYTNDPKKDPDYFCGAGPAWALPLRWLLMDTAYITCYFHPEHYSNRPADEKLGFWLSMVFGAAVLIVVIAMGWFEMFLLLYFIPTRIALFFLAITFDYLPHVPHQTKAKDNPYRATNNRIGMEWLFSPLFVGHNYHLSHHLFPNAPFYRYRKIWLVKREELMSKNPSLVMGAKLMPEKSASSGI